MTCQHITITHAIWEYPDGTTEPFVYCERCGLILDDDEIKDIELFKLFGGKNGSRDL